MKWMCLIFFHVLVRLLHNLTSSKYCMKQCLGKDRTEQSGNIFDLSTSMVRLLSAYIMSDMKIERRRRLALVRFKISDRSSNIDNTIE